MTLTEEIYGVDPSYFSHHLEFYQERLAKAIEVRTKLTNIPGGYSALSLDRLKLVDKAIKFWEELIAELEQHNNSKDK